jgi:hypothetical protein
MKRVVLLTSALIAVCSAAIAQDSQAKPACNKLPYRLGHLVTLNSTDLRDYPRATSKKESKEMSKKLAKAQSECDAFVSKHPGNPVSMDWAFTVEGLAAYYGRCESFCGTEKDRSLLLDKETREAIAPEK